MTNWEHLRSRRSKFYHGIVGALHQIAFQLHRDAQKWVSLPLVIIDFLDQLKMKEYGTFMNIVMQKEL